MCANIFVLGTKQALWSQAKSLSTPPNMAAFKTSIAVADHHCKKSQLTPSIYLLLIYPGIKTE